MEVKNEDIQKQNKTSLFQKLKHFLDTTLAENLVLIIYTVFSFFLVLVHEPWRDEAQFWLLARDASLPELLRNISKEGIPPLWQIMLKPFAMLGLPYYPTISIISFLLVAAAAWIFVKKAPLYRFAKYVLLFSPIFIYCYSTVSRSYSLIPITFVLLAVLYPKRLQRPILYGLLIAVLFEIHIVLWGVVAALSIEFLVSTIAAYKKESSVKQTARSLTAAIPMLIVALHYLLFYYAAAKTSSAISDFSLQTNPLSIIYTLLFGVGTVFGNTLAGREFVGIYLAIIFAALFLASIMQNKRWLKYALIAGGSILFEGIISGFVYIDGNFRSISVFLILTFVIWIAKNENLSLEINLFNTRTTWVTVVCVYAFFGMLTVAPLMLKDIQHPFSYSRYTASYIEKNISKDSLILTSSDAQMCAVSAYLDDYTFYDSEKEKPYTYFVWDNNPDWESVYKSKTNGTEQLTQDIRLSMVAQEALELSNGNEDGFYYMSVFKFSKSDEDPFYQSHIVFRSPEEYESKENYEILYIPFEDAKQLIESYSNPK